MISWCENFVETHSFCRVSDETSETLKKQCISTKFPHQGIGWNFGIFCSGTFQTFAMNKYLVALFFN